MILVQNVYFNFIWFYSKLTYKKRLDILLVQKKAFLVYKSNDF